jgi:hypothetical protein
MLLSQIVKHISQAEIWRISNKSKVNFGFM